MQQCNHKLNTLGIKMKLQNKLEHRGFSGSVEIDFDKNLLHGRILHISDVCNYVAYTPKELIIAFEETVDAYLDDIKVL